MMRSYVGAVIQEVGNVFTPIAIGSIWLCYMLICAIVFGLGTYLCFKIPKLIVNMLVRKKSVILTILQSIISVMLFVVYFIALDVFFQMYVIDDMFIITGLSWGSAFGIVSGLFYMLYRVVGVIEMED